MSTACDWSVYAKFLTKIEGGSGNREARSIFV